MNMPSRKVLSASAICAAALLLFACAKMPGPTEPQVKSLWWFPSDKAVLVGKIELHPPLQPGEQTLMTKQGKKLLKNAFLLFGGNELRAFPAAGPESLEGSFWTGLGEEFFIKVDKGGTFYISGGSVYAAYDPPRPAEFLSFQSPLQVIVRPDEEALYIGTIQLYRDEKNVVKSVLIRDDFRWAETQFKKRLGKKKTLRKALASPVRGTP